MTFSFFFFSCPFSRYIRSFLPRKVEKKVLNISLTQLYIGVKMESQEEKLESQNSIFFLLTLGRKEYLSNLHVLIEFNEEKLEKTVFADDINIVRILKTIKNLYNLYLNSQVDGTQEAIRKEALLEIAKLLYMFL